METGTRTGRSKASKASGNVTRRYLSTALFVVLVSLAGYGSAPAREGPGPLVIDHHCTDLLSIPSAWVDSAKVNLKMHYAHTSHGGQIPAGMRRLRTADPFFSFTRMLNTLPVVPGSFCIFDGQTSETYITPDLYWSTPTGMNETRAVLSANPSINVSMFCWCTQLDTYSDTYFDAYLDSISVLEAEYPEVTFVYFTGNAQATGAKGYNRWQMNERIRAFCKANDKVLYDFADLDAWWYDPVAEAWDHSTYDYEGNDVPVEHPELAGADEAHTSYESCEMKGRAMWWLASVLSGWPAAGPTGTEDTPSPGPVSALDQNFPNPFNPSTRIIFSLEKAGHARLDIFDAAGRFVRTLVDGTFPAARHEVNWDGRDRSGRAAASGVYFYSITANGFRDTRKMILLR